MRLAALALPVVLAVGGSSSALTTPALPRSTAARADVLVVDAAGGGDHVRLADAVAAASDGDVLLVRAGAYPGEGAIALGTKSLSIVADGGPVTITGQLVVDQLAAGRRLFVRGLTFDNGALSRCLEASDCAGTLWFEDCGFAGFAASLFDTPDPVVLTDCDRVVLRSCTSVGGTGVGGTSGGSGVRAVRTTLFVEGGTLTGGVGAKDPVTLAGDVGGAGLTLEDGLLVMADAELVGGQGGEGGSFGLCADGGDGGVGLYLTGTSPEAVLRGGDLRGGDPGDFIGIGSCSQGLPGAAFQVDAGTLTQSAWPPHAATFDATVRTNELVDATFVGPAGSSVWLGTSFALTTTVLPGWNGALYVAPPIEVGFAGVLDAAGLLAVTRSAALPPGVDAVEVLAQPLYFDPTTLAWTLGPPSVVVLLDPAF